MQYCSNKHRLLSISSVLCITVGGLHFYRKPLHIVTVYTFVTTFTIFNVLEMTYEAITGLNLTFEATADSSFCCVGL